MLYIDVNLGKDKGMQRIVLFEDDKPDHIAYNFA